VEPYLKVIREKCSEALHILDRFHIVAKMKKALDEVRAGESLLKEAFQQLWDYSSPAWAGKFLDEWCQQTMRSRIEPMKKIARSLRQHRELILNYFRAQKLISSGVVEGLNNKAKVTLRKSYGFRTYRALELALYHSLGKLPEPESTHDFF
jgi:transposase